MPTAFPKSPCKLRPVLAASAWVAMMCNGCGSAEPVHVSGMVTYHGKPVPKGFLLIHPDREKGNSGPYGVAKIRDGKFDTREPEGRGAMPGFVKFAIGGYSNEGTAEDYSDAMPLFPPYQVEMQITPEQTTFDIEVPN